MGVDFFACDYCGGTIVDCGPYERCNEDCYRRWCNKKCAAENGYMSEDYDGEGSCSYCRNEAAEDVDLFRFLLKKHELKREDVLQEYINAIKENSHADNA